MGVAFLNDSVQGVGINEQGGSGPKQYFCQGTEGRNQFKEGVGFWGDMARGTAVAS